MDGGIKNWPEGERPREKMQRHGAHALTEAELLAIIIGNGDAASGRSALDLGRDILAAYENNLRALADASCTEIARTKGIGPAKATAIKAALELGNRFRGRRLESLEKFTSPTQVFEHLHYQFRDERKEYFLALLLDGKNRIIKRVTISEGSLNQSIVHPREVFNVAVRESAAALILMHNHPSGDPAPSAEDLEITRRLCEAGELMGIKVLDHIIIGDDAFYSFTERGVM